MTLKWEIHSNVSFPSSVSIDGHIYQTKIPLNQIDTFIHWYQFIAKPIQQYGNINSMINNQTQMRMQDSNIRIANEKDLPRPNTINQSTVLTDSKFDQQQESNLIEQTRSLIENMSQKQRFQKAKRHVEDALRYMHPRPQNELTQQSKLFPFIYELQSSKIWQTILRLSSFIYMYKIILEDAFSDTLFADVSIPLLFIFIVDFIMDVYLISFQNTRKKSKFTNIFYGKLIIICLLAADQAIMIADIKINGRQIHPLRIIRAILPILYDAQIRRSFQSLFSAYKDLFVFFIFYIFVIVGSAIIGTVYIQMPADQPPADEFRSNYDDLSRMVFITYITSSHDSYPDNQLPAIQQSVFYYAFFIGFIFMNMFLYTSIPGSMIFDLFRETRSKIILIDQAKMQHSLLIAFISLGEKNFTIPLPKIIKFLHFLYRNRVRYIDSVTEICMKLNPSDHSFININEFMQLGRVLQANSSLMPPVIGDWQAWIQFRRFIDQKISIKKIVNSKIYNTLISVIILLGSINAAFCLYSPTSQTITWDQIFCYIFVGELIIKLIAIGPQNYINQKFSSLDLGLILVGLICNQFTQQLNYRDALLRLFRIYKATYLIEVLFQNKYIYWKLQIYKKTVDLIRVMIGIMPMIARFLPLFMVVFYVQGIIGMQIFYDVTRMDPNPDFSTYDQFSNFRQFIYTQFIFVQIMTEAGWSSVMFDNATRNMDFYYVGMLFFIFCHMVIVLVMSAMLKSIFWSIFFTVNEQDDQRVRLARSEKVWLDKAHKKVEQLELLDHIIEKTGNLMLDTLVKRQIFQTNGNIQILKKVLQLHRNKKLSRPSIKAPADLQMFRNFTAHREILEDWEDDAKRFQLEDQAEKYIFKIIQKFTREKFKIQNFKDIQQIEEIDFEQKILKLIQKLKKSGYNQWQMTVQTNTLLSKHLKLKLSVPFTNQPQKSARTDNQSDSSSNHSLCQQLRQTPLFSKTKSATQMQVNEISSKQNLTFHIFSLHLLLNMRSSKRQQKAVVVQSLVENGILTHEEGNNLITKKITKNNFNIDENCTLRMMYLSDTNKNLIYKFQAEYFADLYGQAFKEINKITIEPLIRLEANLVYGLKNILRYPQIQCNEFFKILSKFQDEVSNKLLKKGSLFKFVFQLNSAKNIWFSLYYNFSGQIKIHFLKEGVWVYEPTLMKESQIYYGQDIFKLQKDLRCGTLLERTNLMKRLYSVFPSLAFSLRDKERFFQSNPQYHVYDTFLSYIDVSKVQRFIPKALEIEKIMIVLLTRQDERTSENCIPFQISDIEITPPVDQINFKIDETEDQTMQKLTCLSLLNDEEITANEGFPFAYVMNFLCEIHDILKLYSPNFIHQIQKVLNAKLVANEKKDKK